MRLGAIMTRQVVDLESATTIGRVRDATLDLEHRSVSGFVLRSSPSSADWLPWEAVISIGSDAITVQSVRTLTEQPKQPRSVSVDDVLASRVLSDRGVLMASVAEIDFDSETGLLTTITLADGSSLRACDLLGSGSYATMFRGKEGST